MPESVHKKTAKKSRLWLWYRDWKPYFGSRARQSVSHFWSCLTMALFMVVVFVAVLFFAGRSNQIPGFSDMFNPVILIVVVALFVFYFVSIFVFSLHPKTRRIADRLFGFVERTELEQLKEKTESTNKELKEIRRRLKTIETTLETLTNKNKKEGKE